jgi:hypothetical protein
MNRKLTAALLIAAAVLTNLAFTALGSVFNYPDVLKEPVEEILTAFRANQGTVSAWFVVLALSAARPAVTPRRPRPRRTRSSRRTGSSAPSSGSVDRYR